MKRIITSVITLIIFSLSCMTQTMLPDVSRRAAVNFWNSHRTEANKAIAFDEPVLYSIAEFPMLRIYAVGEEGFVIVSAYDGVLPILGYSFDSPANDEVNPEAAYWLRGMNAEIANAQTTGYRNPEADSLWNTLLTAPVPPEPVSLTNIPAMLETRWDQGSPFNKLCPYDQNYHARAVVGCVATAMAQIMKYWNHPSSGTGAHSYTHNGWGQHATSYGEQSADFEHTTYMWDYMENSYISSVTNSAVSEHAVAVLSYHCGVAVDMMYGPSATGGSGAYSSCGGWTSACAEHAFYDYFKYSPDLIYRERNSNVWYNGQYVETYYYSDSAWNAMLDDELAQGHPLYYDGSDSTGGHAFVCDGSDLNGRYHFNWGWSGSYNGFYYTNRLNLGGGGDGANATYTFNRDQGVIFGIVPLEEHFDTVTIYDTICNSEAYYHFHDYEFPAVSDTLQAIWLDTVFIINLKVLNTRTLYLNPNGGSGLEEEMHFCPVDGVVMPESPFVRLGYHFIGWGEKRANNTVIYQPGDTLWLRSSKSFYAQWRDSSTLAIEEPENTGIFIYPQPTDGWLNIDLDNDEDVEITICDTYGRVLIQRRTIGGKAKISLKRLPSGTYTVMVAVRGKKKKKQIIKI